MDCLDRSIEDLAAEFQAENSKDIITVFGGDGALVGKWRELEGPKGKRKVLLPVRNYGMCPEHEELYKKVFTQAEDAPQLKQFLFPVLRSEFKINESKNYLNALAEFTVVSADRTAALRFNIKINNKLFGENIIGDGLIISSKLGSTGYYKSITRTMFVEGIGIGFINPVYSIPNFICKQSDIVEFELIRNSKIILTADKLKQEIDALKGWKIIFQDSCKNIPILGYDHFMCQKCRNNRNSSYINDIYSLI